MNLILKILLSLTIFSGLIGLIVCTVALYYPNATLFGLKLSNNPIKTLDFITYIAFIAYGVIGFILTKKIN